MAKGGIVPRKRWLFSDSRALKMTGAGLFALSGISSAAQILSGAPHSQADAWAVDTMFWISMALFMLMGYISWHYGREFEKRRIEFG